MREGREPPADWPDTLQALWHAERGDWDRAHRIAQEIHSPVGSWIHANLHREEGDDDNAGYWYRRAGRPHSRLSFHDERLEIVRALERSGAP